VLTNEAGQFELPLLVQNAQAVPVSASKNGYEPDFQYSTGSSRDLTLHDILRIPVGESVRVTIGPNDAYVEDEEGAGYRKRVVRVMASEAMTVYFRLAGDETRSASIISVRDTQLLYPPRVHVTGAIELAVEVGIPWLSLAGRNRTFTLSTSRQEW
jgi:hypothetical protein